MDLRQLMQLLQQSTPSNVGVGQLTENEARRLMESGTEEMSSGMGNLTEAEAARIKQLIMQQQMDEFSRQNAFMSNPQAVPYYQKTNPLGNTMTNVAPQGGGLSVKQPRMDLNSLIRILSR